MKKLFTLLTSCIVTVSINAQIELVTMTTVKTIGEKVNLEICSTKPFSIDWGNGEKTNYNGSMVNYTQVASAVIKGNTIKIYGESAAFTYLSCTSNQLVALDVSKATSLTHLYCYYNQISTLDVSKNTALKYLLCFYNMMSDLNVNNNPVLITLECQGNQLTKIEVDKDLALLGFNCSGNELTLLDVSKNTALINLLCNYNQLTTLNVSANTSLNYLECGSNQLTTLNVSANTSLNYLECSSNQLSILDLTNNTALNTLFCSNNQLYTLNISSNTPFTTFYCSNNQLNTEILNTLYGLLPNISDVTIGVYDPVTKKKLVIEGNPGSLTSNTRTLSVKGWICDIEGDPKMTALPELISMTTSKAIGEEVFFYISSSKTYAIDWGNGEKCGYASNTISMYKSSKIKGPVIEIYGDKTSLTQLSCSSNLLTALDVGNNPALIGLICSDNQLISLDLSKNLALNSVACNNNQLANLVISKSPRLMNVYCYSNELKGKTMTAFADSLCNYPDFMKGELYIIETSNPAEKNEVIWSVVETAKIKNWNVFNWMGSRDQSIAYLGMDPNDIKELQTQGINIYYTTGFLHVTTEQLQMISIFTIDGQMLFEKSAKYLHMPLSKGIYIVKIGNTSQKVIVK